jgi:hypothetical protein
VKKPATPVRPATQVGLGGIESVTSSWRRAMMASRSPFSHARTYRSSSARSTAPASGDHSARGPTRSSRVTRARWRALFADDTEHERAAAVSAAERPTTSRRRSTARCGGVST